MRARKMPALLAVLFILVCSCVNATINPRDDRSIANWGNARLQYQEDISRTAGLDDPALLVKEKFPIGKLTWDEYQANLATYDAWRGFEESKANPGDNRGGN